MSSACVPSRCSPIDRDRVAVLEAGIEHDALAGGQPVDAVTERLDHAGAVRAEDPRLRHRGQPPAYPDVEMVERRGPETDENLARPGDGVGYLLHAEDVRAAVLVDPGREHGTILS